MVKENDEYTAKNYAQCSISFYGHTMYSPIFTTRKGLIHRGGKYLQEDTKTVKLYRENLELITDSRKSPSYELAKYEPKKLGKNTENEYRRIELKLKSKEENS